MNQEISYIPITSDRLDKVSAAGAKWGMPRSVGWLKRILFDPTIQDMTDDVVRGHMAVLKATGEVVAIQCYYYQPLYFKKKKILAQSGCIMGADRKYGAEIFCVLEKNTETVAKTDAYCVNDLANIKSSSIHKYINQAKDVPIGSSFCYIRVTDVSWVPAFIISRIPSVKNVIGRVALKLLKWIMFVLSRPFQWLIDLLRCIRYHCSAFNFVRHKELKEEYFAEFWRDFLSANTGLTSSRDPERLKWLFGESIKAGKVLLTTAEKGGHVKGYVMMRRLPCLSYIIYEIIDICAIANDRECLRALTLSALISARKYNGYGVKLFCYKGDVAKWFSGPFCIKRNLDHSTFLYRVRDSEIEASLERDEGWFFGPLDGERCMGYGGYIDL